MEFRLTPDEQAFRDEVRGFLDKELPAGWDGGGDFGEGETDESAAFSQQMSRKLAQKNWLAMAWPKEYGGLNATHMQQLLYSEEMAYRRAPGGFSMGVAWVGPAIMLYGTDEQKKKYLPRITEADDVWCTLYSEPGAGSDLASVQTRAVEDGDDFVINGQKIWTSGAHRADWGWMAARTDPDAPKHKGISTFVIDMKSPGITIRPLINMANQHGFNEVFFDNVRIPKDNIVGEKNRGWYHVAVALDFERSSIAGSAGALRTLEEMIAFAREERELVRKNPTIPAKLASLAIEIEVGRYLSYRVVSQQQAGQIPNYEASVAKMYSTEMGQRQARIGMEMLGLHGALQPGSKYAKMKGRFERSLPHLHSMTIGGGTSEVNRNVIATRGLGMPRG